jgi:hypothetical protein
MSETVKKMMVGGRGEPVGVDPQRQAELLRTLAERSAKSGPPSARRRAIALAGIRIAKTIEGTQRGKA